MSAAAATDWLLRSGVRYALLDAARDPRVLGRVLAKTTPRACLYGEADADLAPYGPWIVELDDALLSTLAREGWGASWGVFLRARDDLDALRAHFSRYTVVPREDGQEHFFRFYDPRVLRALTESWSPTQLAALLGPVEALLMEGASPDAAVTLVADAGGARVEVVALP